MRAMTPYDFPQTSASTPEERQLAERHLHAEQVRLLYRFSLVGYLATLMVAFILGAILWKDLERPALFAWSGSAPAFSKSEIMDRWSATAIALAPS